MSLKRKTAIAGSLIFFLSLLLVCLLTGAYFYLPVYLETRILPQLAADAGISDFAVKVRNVGFYSADLAGLRLGPPNNPALVIHSVQVDYSPRSLYQQKIENITLSGIDLHGEVADGGFKLRGVDIEKIAAAQRPEKKSVTADDPAPPVFIAKLQIRDSQLIIAHNRQFYRIPFEIDIEAQDSNYKRLDVAAAIYPGGEKITAVIKVDRPRSRAAVNIDSTALNLNRFAGLAGRAADLMLSGEMALHGNAQVLWQPVRIASVNASLTLQHAKIKVGEIQLQNAMAAGEKEVPFRIDLTGKGDGEWQFTGSRISMAAPMPLTLAGIDGTIKRNAAALESSGNFNLVIDSSTPAGQNLLPLKFRDPIALPGRFSAIYHQSENTPKVSAEVKFELRAPSSAIKLKDGIIKMPDIVITAKLNRDDDRQISLGGELQFNGAGGQFSRSGAQVEGARGKIPFQWPVEEKSAKGSVSVAGLKYKGTQLGSVSSQVRQTATGFAFEGRHQSTLFPMMKLNFSGASRLFNVASVESNLRVELSRPDSAPEIDLGKFFPEASGFRTNGKIDLQGNFTLDGRGFNGNLQADLNDFRLFSAPNKLALEGIRMSLNFPELPQIRSAPGQSLQFHKFSLGNLTTERGRIDFQIESARSLLIEKMHFFWCEGGVETQAMRVSPGVQDYRITFFCDRLNLAKVLEQFGAANAEGRGAVNGRIPLQYTNGKISFDDGFLYSTPGDGGKIRLTGTDILTAGIPPNTPQFVQMELAREALKDYDYTWAKLNITSQGEELLLQMQMDGKPANTLPFVYRKDIGGFVKVEADAKGSTFQGIRLDVNFRLPLNKLLQYKGLIDMIQ